MTRGTHLSALERREGGVPLRAGLLGHGLPLGLGRKGCPGPSSFFVLPFFLL
jgi:hypothetical protein